MHPSQDASHHQNYWIFSWDPYSPSLSAVNGRGSIPKSYLHSPKHPNTETEVRYLDPKNIPKTPNLRSYDWMSRVGSICSVPAKSHLTSLDRAKAKNLNIHRAFSKRLHEGVYSWLFLSITYYTMVFHG